MTALQLLPAVQTPPQGAWRPHPRAPSQQALSYAKTALELLLVLLGIPWIIRELTRHPGRVSRKAAAKHLAD